MRRLVACAVVAVLLASSRPAPAAPDASAAPAVQAPARPVAPSVPKPALPAAPSLRTPSRSPVATPAPPAAPERRAARRTPLIAVLCYHDIGDSAGAPLQTVSPEFLRRQIRDCKKAGWTFLALGELLAKRDHPEQLPPRVLVLTFDDGYRSFLDRALPVLREEGVRATLGVITSFVDRPPPELPPLLDWDQLRAIDRAGDVEIASHSHDLHRYEMDNPFRDTAPSVAVRRWLAAESRYESREEYRSRVRADLDETQRTLNRQLGHPATTLVWPYGYDNDMADGIAAIAGLGTTLTLGWRPATLEDLRAARLPRIMVTRYFRFTSDAWLHPPAAAIRAADVDLDDVYDPDPAAFRARVDRLVERLRSIGATHVFLSACSDSGHSGRLRGTWFTSHQAPLRADAASMVMAKLTRARIKVWLRTPTMNLSWAWERHPEWRLEPDPDVAADSLSRIARTRWPNRLRIDRPDARRAVIDYLTDLAVYLPIDGLLFEDDACVLRGESLSGGRGSDPAVREAAIAAFLDECEEAVHAWRPECPIGRTVTEAVAGVAGVHPSLAQDLSRSLAEDPLTVVRTLVSAAAAPPRRIGPLARRVAARWRSLVRAGEAPAGADEATVPALLEFEARDPATDRWVPGRTLLAMLIEARRGGLTHAGIRPVTPGDGDLPARLLEGAAAAEFAGETYGMK